MLSRLSAVVLLVSGCYLFWPAPAWCQSGARTLYKLPLHSSVEKTGTGYSFLLTVVG